MAKKAAVNPFAINKDELKKNYTVEKGSSIYYSPNPKDATGGVYSATIRFLPRIENINKPYVNKFGHYLSDEDGNFYVDAKTDKSEKDIISETFFKFYNSKNAVEKAKAEKFKRTQICVANILIVKDEQHPELVGKVMPFRFGKVINDMIQVCLNDYYDDNEDGFNPFDPIEGHNFNLKVTIKSGYNNYDQSKFSNKESVLSVEGVDADDTDALVEWCNENIPSLNDFEPKAWTNEEETRIKALIKSETTGVGGATDVVLNPNDEDDDFDDDDEDDAKVGGEAEDEDEDDEEDEKPSAKSKSKSKSKATKKVEDDDDDFDNIDDEDF